MLDQTASLSVMYFSVPFEGSIVTISMDRITPFRLDVSASLGLLQYEGAHSMYFFSMMEHTPILKKA